MGNFWNQAVEINRHKVQPAKRSTSPTARQKQTSEYLNQKIGDEFPVELKEMGYQRVTFDADIKGNSIIVQKAFLIHDSGEVEILEMKSKHRMKGHSISTSLRKWVSGLAMSLNFPIPLLLYFKEIDSMFKENILLKLSFATVLGSLFSIMKTPIEDFIIGFGLFLIIAIADAVLGVMPNIKSEVDTSKEHKLLAKFWKFSSNCIAMVGLYYFHLFTISLLPKENWTTFIPHNIHYFGIAFVSGIYCVSIFKYIAIANNTKIPLPDSVMNRFKKK